MLTTETLMHWARLKRTFEVAKRFDVVLLLDEVDVFMECPIASHGSHNRLVTAFLRNFKYCEGILFLASSLQPEPARYSILPDADTALLS